MKVEIIASVFSEKSVQKMDNRPRGPTITPGSGGGF